MVAYTWNMCCHSLMESQNNNNNNNGDGVYPRRTHTVAAYEISAVRDAANTNCGLNSSNFFSFRFFVVQRKTARNKKWLGYLFNWRSRYRKPMPYGWHLFHVPNDDDDCVVCVCKIEAFGTAAHQASVYPALKIMHNFDLCSMTSSCRLCRHESKSKFTIFVCFCFWLASSVASECD